MQGTNMISTNAIYSFIFIFHCDIITLIISLSIAATLQSWSMTTQTNSHLAITAVIIAAIHVVIDGLYPLKGDDCNQQIEGQSTYRKARYLICKDDIWDCQWKWCLPFFFGQLNGIIHVGVKPCSRCKRKCQTVFVGKKKSRCWTELHIVPET